MESTDYYKVKALSNSGMTDLLKCPALYKYKMEHQDTSSEAFILGQLFHLFMEDEQKALSPSSSIQPKQFSGNTKQGKDEVQEAAKKGIQLVAMKKWDNIVDMTTAIKENQIVQLLLSCPGENEKEYYCTKKVALELEGKGTVLVDVPCKAKLDRVVELNGKKIVIDYKSTADSDPNKVIKSIINFCYHRQAAWYLDIADADEFVFLFIGKDKPHLVFACTLSKELLELGKQEYEKALIVMATCIHTGQYPDYVQMNNGIITIEAPSWLLAKNNTEDFDSESDEEFEDETESAESFQIP